MKKAILGLISLSVVLGCSSGDTPGPVDPTAGNKEAQAKKTEEMMNNIPPEFRDRAKQSAGQSGDQRFQRPPGK